MAATAGVAPIESPPDADLSANQAPRIIASGICFIVLPTVSVALRFLARWLSKAGLWWDDWIALAALIVSWGPNGLMMYSVTRGFGVHIASFVELTTRIAVAEFWFQQFYAYAIMWTLAVTLSKVSILLFYSRIFKEKRFLLALKIVAGFLAALFFSAWIVVFAMCIPIQALWDPTVNGTCINIFAFFQGAGAPNTALNVIILVLPLPMIWALQIDLKHKLALSGVFLLGSFVVVVSIIRLVIFSEIQIFDVTWEFVDAAIWNAAEPSIAVCSASLPILRSLWVWNRRLRSGPNGAQSPESYQEPKAPVNTRVRGGVSKARHHLGNKKGGSFSSQQYPLNELPAGVQQVLGNRVVVAAPAQSRKISDDEEMWEDLPIMHPQEAAFAAYGRQQYNATPATPSERSELYG